MRRVLKGGGRRKVALRLPGTGRRRFLQPVETSGSGLQLRRSLVGYAHDGPHVPQRQPRLAQRPGSHPRFCCRSLPGSSFFFAFLLRTRSMFLIGLGKNGDDVNDDVVLRQSRKVCDGLADVVACLVESANLRDRADLGAFGDPPPCAPAFGCDSESAAHRHHPFPNSSENWSKNLRAVRSSISA